MHCSRSCSLQFHGSGDRPSTAGGKAVQPESWSVCVFPFLKLSSPRSNDSNPGAVCFALLTSCGVDLLRSLTVSYVLLRSLTVSYGLLRSLTVSYDSRYMHMDQVPSHQDVGFSTSIVIPDTLDIPTSETVSISPPDGRHEANGGQFSGNTELDHANSSGSLGS